MNMLWPVPRREAQSAKKKAVSQGRSAQRQFLEHTHS
eukprot:SAG11_NODE_18521_length_488_cov_2.848329_1_plen_36_part_10